MPLDEVHAPYALGEAVVWNGDRLNHAETMGREKAADLAQQSYQYKLEQGRADKAEARATQKQMLDMENTIRGNLLSLYE